MNYSRTLKHIFSKQFSQVGKTYFSSEQAGHQIAIPRKEIRVPCPWGHISGVWWGRDDVQPIVAVHGWLDNSGSWKQLARCLVDDNTSLLALDLPGTGHSSHLPPFYNYHFSSSAPIIYRVLKHFDFKDVILFGHSGGSATTFLLSALYPDMVKAYLGVDYLFYSYKREEARAAATGEVLDEFIDLALKGTSLKSYTWEEGREAWINGSLLGATNPERIEDLMEGGMMKDKDKYSFSRDIRLRHLKATALDCFSIGQTEALAKSIACHVCIIKAKDSPFFELGIRNFPGLVEVVRESSKSFEFHEIEGHHHVHMEYPEEVASIARSFLNSMQ